MCADMRMITDVTVGFDDGVCADASVGLDDREGAYAGRGRNFCRGMNVG